MRERGVDVVTTPAACRPPARTAMAPPPPQCASKPPSAPPALQVGDMAEEEEAPSPPPPKLLYIAVADGEGRRAFRYTRPVLQSTLHLMGCKPRHAFKIRKRVFNVMKSEFLAASKSEGATNQENCPAFGLGDGTDTQKMLERSNSSIPFELYKNQITVVISREKFVSVVCDALSLYKYVGPNQKADLLLACRIKERKESVTILLCGISGCGKSTLSSLLTTHKQARMPSAEQQRHPRVVACAVPRSQAPILDFASTGDSRLSSSGTARSVAAVVSLDLFSPVTPNFLN